MISTCQCRLPLLGALLLLLAAPAGARAACGDYLHIAGKDQETKPATPAPKPCDGPQCSQRSLPVVPAAPFPPPTVSDDVGCLASTTAAGDARLHAGWPTASDDRLALHTPSDIFHPPR